MAVPSYFGIFDFGHPHTVYFEKLLIHSTATAVAVLLTASASID